MRERISLLYDSQIIFEGIYNFNYRKQIFNNDKFEDMRNKTSIYNGATFLIDVFSVRSYTGKKISNICILQETANDLRTAL